MYLLDTMLVSELREARTVRAAPGVVAWAASVINLDSSHGSHDLQPELTARPTPSGCEYAPPMTGDQQCR
ncbi:hypothetical protein CKO25_05210 [Thiocapsa imhoffii]|uniref:Uncharacterized protein n=1 Tax=Thiocapsa imhoffii TaxID=382777 RepID=A0A9X1B8K4_9GAMM|nr:hypothetical protein [Thiocapsa imhoffii]